MANELASSTRPYLRACADNPVDWWMGNTIAESQVGLRHLSNVGRTEWLNTPRAAA